LTERKNILAIEVYVDDDLINKPERKSAEIENAKKTHEIILFCFKFCFVFDLIV
jgi:hypothetical protein